MLPFRPVAEVEVTFGLTAINWVKFTLSVDFSTRKPLSSDELSVQLRLICVALTAVAVNPLGAFGGAALAVVAEP